MALPQLSSLTMFGADRIDSAMRAQEGEAALMPTHYLTASFLFDSQSPPQDQFDLLTIDLRPRSSAPELHQNTFNSSLSPNAVFLISTIVNTGGNSGKGAGMTLGFVNIFELKPYAEMGFESFPYDEAWREGFMSEVNGEGNPYDDYMLVVLQRINEEATSAVDRKRAEIALRERYPTAKPQLWKTQQYSEVS